jgi:hypothetical protein
MIIFNNKYCYSFSSKDGVCKIYSWCKSFHDFLEYFKSGSSVYSNVYDFTSYSETNRSFRSTILVKSKICNYFGLSECLSYESYKYKTGLIIKDILE